MYSTLPKYGAMPGSSQAGARGIGAMFEWVFEYDGTVAGEFERHGYRRRAANCDRLVDTRHRFPLVLVPIFVGCAVTCGVDV
jgi:hypothetical protein